MTPATRWVSAGIAAVVLLGAGLASWMMVTADPERSRLIARGKVVYAQQCASCHGANLEGQPNWRERLPNGLLPAPPHDASGHTWHHSDKQLFEMVKNGLGETVPGYETDMPAYRGMLSDADISAVISFIESTWPADIRARQESLNRRP